MSFVSRFDEFHEQAAAAIGLSDFGPNDYQAPLRILLDDLDASARFSPEGAQIGAGTIIGKLVGRLFTEQGFKTYPQFAAARIEKPIIIIGMPRTGTTALQRIMAADPAIQALDLWLGSMPMPRPPRETWENNPVFQGVRAGLDQMLGLNPRIKDIHPLFPEQPDECRAALDQTFWATSLAQTMSAPNYGEWCLAADATYAYERYHQILRLIAGGDKRRWLLKNPDHIWALDALLTAFPDACIVQTHRDLAISMPSVCSLSYEVSRLYAPDKSRLQHGDETRIWMRALEKAEAVRSTADPARFFDLHNDEIQADPVGAVERIYAHFGMPVDDGARHAWHARIQDDPRSSHGVHRYNLQDWGLTAAGVWAEAKTYHKRYVALCQERNIK
ncbi:MAG: sulfotransferase [Caulobacterales bacterium]